MEDSDDKIDEDLTTIQKATDTVRLREEAAARCTKLSKRRVPSLANNCRNVWWRFFRINIYM